MSAGLGELNAGKAAIAAALLVLSLLWETIAPSFPYSQHRRRFLWRFHRTHHSDPRMDVTTARRSHLGEIISSSGLRIPVLALLGLSLAELAVYETVQFVVVQCHHANIGLPPRLDRWLRLFVVTPAMHKVRHSRWGPETDSNPSSLLSIWDRSFRTFRLRADPRSIVFGLDHFDDPEQQTLAGLFKTPLDRPAAEPKPSPAP